MRTVILVDLDRLYGMNTVLATTEPKEGEEVAIEHNDTVRARGKVANVRPCPTWPERWVYDVKVG